MWRLDTFPNSECVQQNTINGEGRASVTEKAHHHTPLSHSRTYNKANIITECDESVRSTQNVNVLSPVEVFQGMMTSH